MNNKTPHSSAYRSDIDGLRAVAVLGVVIYHAFPKILKGGFVGVDVFFVISGFLIGGIILRDLAEGNFSFLHFYARRVLRIFPALILVLCAVLGAGYFLLFDKEYEMLGKHVFGGAAFIANLMYYAESGYWDMSANLKPLLHLWSLGVEEQFYFVIPVVLAVAWKWKFRPVPLILVLLIASFVCNIRYYRNNEDLDFYMPFTRFWEIFMGALLAALMERARPPHSDGTKSGNSRARAAWAALAQNDWRYARLALSVAGLVFLIIGLDSRGGHYPGHRAIWPTLGTMFILAAGPQAWLNRSVLSNRLAVGIGLISYPLYLWHWPLLSFAIILNGDFSGAKRWFVIRLVCMLLSFVLAVLTYVLVERPLRFGKSGRKAKIGALAVLMACVGGTGLSLFLTGATTRAYMAPYQAKVEDMEKRGGLISPLSRDSNILRYIPGAGALDYARYEDAGGKRTVAVMGDSHTPPIFEGMVEVNRELDLGLNIVCLQYSPRYHRESTLAAVKSKADISDVFIVIRGVFHFAHGNDVDGPHKINPAEDRYLGDRFKLWLQELVDELHGAGKRVYMISENPVFPALLHIPMERPFALNELGPPVMTKEEVYNHQKACLDMLAAIQGAEFINGMDVFCPDGACSLFSEDGISLYADDDHLSVYGGKYLVRNLLTPYLSAIAEREE